VPDYATVEVGEVTVMAPRDRMALGIALGELADQPFEWPGLGRRSLGPIRLMLAPDQAAFDRISRGRLPSWGAGLALPAVRTVVVRVDLDDPRTALRHELAHLALHGAVPGRVPLWFDEGYAVVAAREWDRLAALQLNLAVARGRVPGLDGLDAALRRSELEAEVAYALAGSAVAELARRNPSGTLEPLLSRLTAGEPFGTAVLATTGLTLDRFDEAWHREVRRRYSLVVWLVAGGGWGLLGLVTVAIVLIRRRRDLPRRQALDSGWVIPPEAMEEAASLDQDGPAG
jgi:hypothetical protein